MGMQTYMLKFLLYFFFNDTGINCTTHSANSGMIIKTLPQHSTRRTSGPGSLSVAESLRAVLSQFTGIST